MLGLSILPKGLDPFTLDIFTNFTPNSCQLANSLILCPVCQLELLFLAPDVVLVNFRYV